MKRYTVVTVLAITILFTITAAAQQDNETGTVARRPAGQMMGRGMMGGNMMGSGMNMMAMQRMIQAEWDIYLLYQDDLGLTADQVEELQDIRIEHLRETTDTRGELQVATQELVDMLSADEYNLNEVSRKISDVHDYQVELEVAQVSASAEARDVLTAEQLVKARDLRRQGMRGMMDGSGMRDYGNGGMMRGGQRQ